MNPARFAKLRAVLDRRQPDLTVLAENVHKPHNISAVLRSCDAVGVHELHAVSPGGEFARQHMVSGGSRRWVGLRTHDGITQGIGSLKANNFQIVAAHFSDTAVDYRGIDYTRPTAIVLGAELSGVSAAAARLADAHAQVPMRGMVASLNVSVAAAVILYEAARQREAAGFYARPRLDAETYRDTLFEWCYPEVARICRANALPYPALDAEGFILRPGSARAIRSARRQAGTGPRTSGAGS